MSKKEQEAVQEEAGAQANGNQEATNESGEAQEAPESTDTPSEEQPEPELSEADQLRAQLQESKDKYLRLYSEFENFRKRTAKEKLELMRTAGEDVIKDMLPVLDDFERAIASNEKSEDLGSMKEGFNLLHQKFSNLMSQKGVKEIEAMEQEFDLDLHEALTKIPAPSKKLKGKVVDVIEKGYKLNDKVIRYAKVVIGE